jgi:hypothetical protein
MPGDVLLRCQCGQVRGVACQVSPVSGFRFICYCTDCQMFSRFLGRPDVLDAQGGTDIFQMPPARLAITAGADLLRCVRLSDQVLRWYAECCKTPIANTAARPGFPIAGVIHTFFDRPLDVLGPPLCRLFDRSALAPLPATTPPPASMKHFARRASRLLGWWVRGLARPTPFFDERTQAPRATPHVITPGERAASSPPR